MGRLSIVGVILEFKDHSGMNTLPIGAKFKKKEVTEHSNFNSSSRFIKLKKIFPKIHGKFPASVLEVKEIKPDDAAHRTSNSYLQPTSSSRYLQRKYYKSNSLDCLQNLSQNQDQKGLALLYFSHEMSQ